MGRKAKPFIEKKNAFHFQLVHRSSLGDAEGLSDEPNSSSKYVLQPLQGPKGDPEAKFPLDYLQGDEIEVDAETSEPQYGEAAKYGIFYDDREYDYLQHLKSVGQTSDAVLLNAPCSKPSSGKNEDFVKDDLQIRNSNENSKNKEEEDDEGDQEVEDIDGDFIEDPNVKEVLEALNDEAFNVENDEDFEDDLIKVLDETESNFGTPDIDLHDDDHHFTSSNVGRKSKGTGGKRVSFKENEYFYFSNNNNDNDNNDDDDDDSQDESIESYGSDYSGEEQRTNFSMSSSSLFRNEKLTLLDDQFDRVLEEYDDDEIGALDEEEIQGETNFDRYQDIFDELLQANDVIGKKLRKQNKDQSPMERLDELRRDILMTNEGCNSESVWIKRLQSYIRGEGVAEVTESEEIENDLLKVPESENVVVFDRDQIVGVKKEDRWDCESILSTYSNLENHPALIRETRRTQPKIKLNKAGFPVTTKVDPIIEEDEFENELDNSMARLNLGAARPEHESKESKAARKKAIKDQKRLRREEKKLVKEVFKKEVRHQVHANKNKSETTSRISLA